MANHEGICAFSLRKGFDAMFHAPVDRAMSASLLLFSTVTAPSVLSQSLSKEYLRLGGRVVAMVSFSVTPDPLPSGQRTHQPVDGPDSSQIRLFASSTQPRETPEETTS